MALKQLKVTPVLAWSWEVGSDCVRVAEAAHPAMRQLGDFAKSDPVKVAQDLAAVCPKGTKVLACAAQPCHDFTSIKGDKACPHALSGFVPR